MTDFAFISNQIGSKDCSDRSPRGKASGRYDYVLKSSTGDTDYPSDACIPFLHYNIRANNIRANSQVFAKKFQGGSFYGKFYGTLNGNKSFDIKHPNKDGWRLRHVCLEGPENAVFFRGRLKDSNVIQLPDYWEGFIDPESITVSLTPIGYTQDLVVARIEWGKRIQIRSGNGSNIDCYFLIHATRKDTEKLIPEYIGHSPANYPGDNNQYSVAGYHYDVRNLEDSNDAI